MLLSCLVHTKQGKSSTEMNSDLLALKWLAKGRQCSLVAALMLHCSWQAPPPSSKRHKLHVGPDGLVQLTHLSTCARSSSTIWRSASSSRKRASYSPRMRRCSCKHQVGTILNAAQCPRLCTATIQFNLSNV